jgi:hypothetical protein
VVTCLCQLAGALLEVCDGDARGSEHHLVEIAHQPEAVAVEEHGDEQAAEQLARRLP